MSFSGLRNELVDSVFAELGEDARWSGIADPVRVRRAEYDQDARFGDTEAVTIARFMRVRKSEVPSPQVEDVIDLVDDAGEPIGERYQVTGEAKLRRNAYWIMPVMLLG